MFRQKKKGGDTARCSIFNELHNCHEKHETNILKTRKKAVIQLGAPCLMNSIVVLKYIT